MWFNHIVRNRKQRQDTLRKEAIVVGYQGYDTRVEDKQGNIWVFEGSDYELGDELILTMYTNHTDENIYDDEIINVKIKK